MRALQWCQGLVLYKIRKQSPSDMELRVFDLNTRVATTVPRSPKCINAYGWHRRSVFGMLIDRSVRPYAWKLVQGNEDANTQIYDSRSNSWIVRPSRMLHNEVRKVGAGFFSQEMLGNSIKQVWRILAMVLCTSSVCQRVYWCMI